MTARYQCAPDYKLLYNLYFKRSFIRLYVQCVFPLADKRVYNLSHGNVFYNDRNREARQLLAWIYWYPEPAGMETGDQQYGTRQH